MCLSLLLGYFNDNSSDQTSEDIHVTWELQCPDIPNIKCKMYWFLWRSESNVRFILLDGWHLDDDSKVARWSRLCALCVCWHTSLKLETHSKNGWSVTNQIEYTGLRQDSYLKCIFKLFKSLRSSFKCKFCSGLDKI